MERNTTAEIQAFLHPILAKGSEVEHKKIVEMDGEYVVDGIYHIQIINNYMMNWKNWMFRFRGVATKYLPNYLGWYRFICQHEQADQEWIKNSV